VIRTVEIRPPSVRTETINVLKAAGMVVALVTAYLFGPGFPPQSAVTNRQSVNNLLPYQRLIGDAQSVEQRTFRELREGLLEAERLRASSGKWPDVESLAREGVPPFAPDPTRKGASYKWTSIRQDWITNYVGVPSDPSAPAWALVVLEPAPGEPADPAPNDETHHRLPDGTTLHVTIWTVPERDRRTGFSALRLPQNEGWTQWMIGGN
jgi:uncharacterized protein DUF6162